jgi:hypothetical protein
MEHDKEIYLRVYRDMPFMLEIILRCGEQADSFASEMLFKRVILERETYRLEEERRRDSDKQRQIELEKQQEYKSE